MSRIGAHLSGLEVRLLTQMSRSNAAAANGALRIATGQKFNNPSDGPAQFVQVATLRNQLSQVNQTVSQVSAANTTAALMQLTVDQIRTELDTIRTSLVSDEDQSLTTEERAAEQAKIDAALAQIDSLASTDLNGQRFFDGSANFTVTGRNSSQIEQVQVFSTAGTSLTGEVTVAATQATATHTGSGGNATADATFTLTGDRGASSISVTNGEALTDVADRINLDSHQTGVTAEVAGDVLTFTSVEHGSEGLVQIEVTSGTFSVSGLDGEGIAQGTDATATINGHDLTGDASSNGSIQGNTITFFENGLHVELELADDFTGTLDSISISSSETLKFSLTSQSSQITELGLSSLKAGRLGKASGTLDQLGGGNALSGLGTNTSQAIRVVDEALAQLTIAEGRVDGFANAAVTSSANLLDGMKEAIEAGIDAVDAVDDTEESLLIAKNQSLASNALASLNILQQQRNDIVAIIRQIAGLS